MPPGVAASSSRCISIQTEQSDDAAGNFNTSLYACFLGTTGQNTSDSGDLLDTATYGCTMATPDSTIEYSVQQFGGRDADGQPLYVDSVTGTFGDYLAFQLTSDELIISSTYDYSFFSAAYAQQPSSDAANPTGRRLLSVSPWDWPCGLDLAAIRVEGPVARSLGVLTPILSQWCTQYLVCISEECKDAKSLAAERASHAEQQVQEAQDQAGQTFTNLASCVAYTVKMAAGTHQPDPVSWIANIIGAGATCVFKEGKWNVNNGAFIKELQEMHDSYERSANLDCEAELAKAEADTYEE